MLLHNIIDFGNFSFGFSSFVENSCFVLVNWSLEYKKKKKRKIHILLKYYFNYYITIYIHSLLLYEYNTDPYNNFVEYRL